MKMKTAFKYYFLYNIHILIQYVVKTVFVGAYVVARKQWVSYLQSDLILIDLSQYWGKTPGVKSGHYILSNTRIL